MGYNTDSSRVSEIRVTPPCIDFPLLDVLNADPQEKILMDRLQMFKNILEIIAQSHAVYTFCSQNSKLGYGLEMRG